MFDHCLGRNLSDVEWAFPGIRLELIPQFLILERDGVALPVDIWVDGRKPRLAQDGVIGPKGSHHEGSFGDVILKLNAEPLADMIAALLASIRESNSAIGQRVLGGNLVSLDKGARQKICARATVDKHPCAMFPQCARKREQALFHCASPH